MSTRLHSSRLAIAICRRWHRLLAATLRPRGQVAAPGAATISRPAPTAGSRPTARPGRSSTRPQGKVYSQFQQSKYKPPLSQPGQYRPARRTSIVGDFVLERRVAEHGQGLRPPQHVLVFGYQDPAHFYYVHFGKKTDDHANQIFIVNGAPREKISTKTTPGTRLGRRLAPGEDRPHASADGTIEVYFDDMRTPGHDGHRQDVHLGPDRHRRVRRPGQFRRRRRCAADGRQGPKPR